MPDIMVDGVLNWLIEPGYADIETVETAAKSTTLSILQGLSSRPVHEHRGPQTRTCR